MMAKIDIFIPYWGEFSLLKEAVDSVLNQNSSNWKLTILDDHYTSLEARNYYRDLKDSRVTYIRHKKNIGITNNFNFARELSKEDYLVIMGCDDKLLPNFVETALKKIGNADFYQPNIEVIDSNSNLHLPLTDRVKGLLRPRREGLYSGQRLAASLCHGNWLYFPSIVWRTSTLKKYSFNPIYKIVEDVDVELSMILDGARLYLDNTYSFQYRRFSESLSSKEKGKNGIRFNEESIVYKQYAKKFSDIGWSRASSASRLRLTSRINQLLH